LKESKLKLVKSKFELRKADENTYLENIF